MTQSVKVHRLSSTQPDFQERLDQLLRFDAAQDEAIGKTVKAIVADIRSRGDQALLEMTARFDGVTATSVAQLEISKTEMQQALDQLTPDARHALTVAAERIRRFHELHL